MEAVSHPQVSFGDLSGFSSLRGHHYLNHAAISPPSQWVQAGISDVLDRFAQRGSGAFLEVVETRMRLKERLASLLGAPSTDGSDFAWCSNTTSGVQAIAHAFPWRKGRGIVVFDGEFPTNVIPWEQAARREMIPVYRASLAPLMAPEAADLGPLERLLRQGVQLVAISAVQFQTGFRAPIRALAMLCKRYEAALFIDGIQACGSTPLPLEEIDFMSTGGHKWMMAVEGAGFMYIHPRWRGRLTTQQAGWLSVEEPLDFLFAGHSTLNHTKPIRDDFSAFEGGAQSAVCYAALDASTKILESLSIPAIYRHIQCLLDPLEEGLLQRGFHSARLLDPSRRSCSLSVRPPLSSPFDVAEWSSRLIDRHITVSTPDGWLRFSPHWPNHLEQISVVLEALDEIMESA